MKAPTKNPVIEVVMPWGPYQGERITRVPPSYLFRLRDNPCDAVPPGDWNSWSQVAQAELDRRGTYIPEVEVTSHAIDQASLRILPVWRREAGEREGLHRWMAHTAMSALTFGVPCDTPGRYYYLGVCWVFNPNEECARPVLQTCWRK